LQARARAILAGFAALATAAVACVPDLTAAVGKTRTIALYNIHTKETLSILYKKDGKYVPEALEKINYFMRDWRKNIVIKMDPELIDLLWEIHTELGSREPIHLICGHRSQETNEMLRKSVGGQASQSQHITGKAADVHFPDVAVKQLRYSALIRERGGVGYYPTSAIPFVHVDTARVRAWPRLPRHELALLFPNGYSQHVPADGTPITREDVKAAQARHKELATQVAAFLEFRKQPKTQLVAAAARAPEVSAAPAARATPWPESAPKMAALEPVAPPRLVSEPRLVERISRFTPGPSDIDRSKLDKLVTLAAYETPPPRLLAPPKLAVRPKTASEVAMSGALGAAGPAPAAKDLQPERRVAEIDPATVSRAAKSVSDAIAAEIENWTPAPAWDEEHPDELSYRPFPLAPLLTASASPDDPALAQLVHHDVASTLDFIDQEGAVLPLRFRPGEQVAQLMWAQQFQGSAVDMSRLSPSPPAAAGLSSRAVRTSVR
jgi:uncharacterized protein YcbK (DUF882 family)